MLTMLSSQLFLLAQKTCIILHHMMGCHNFHTLVQVKNGPIKLIFVYIEIFLLHVAGVNSHLQTVKLCNSVHSYNASSVVMESHIST
jgi:hypothetical protein